MEHINSWSMLDENINTKVLLGASREVSLEINTEKTKYMFMSSHQNAGQNHKLLIANGEVKVVPVLN
jgi:hypothetical protein